MIHEIPGLRYGPEFLFRPRGWNQRTPPPIGPRNSRNRWRKRRASGRG